MFKCRSAAKVAELEKRVAHLETLVEALYDVEAPRNPRARKYDDDTVVLFKKLYKKGLRPHYICQKMNITYNQYAYLQQAFCSGMGDPRVTGRKERQVKVEQYYKQGKKAPEIALLLSCPESTIYNDIAFLKGLKKI